MMCVSMNVTWPQQTLCPIIYSWRSLLSLLMSSANFVGSGSQRVVSEPVTPTPSGSLSEMSVLRSHPRPTKSETLGEGPRNLCFNKSSRWFWHTQVGELWFCGYEHKTQSWVQIPAHYFFEQVISLSHSFLIWEIGLRLGSSFPS